MSQIPLLIATLKRRLKAGGLTYADVANHIGLSEASVKRLFSRHHFSLQTLEAICALLHLELADLVREAEAAQPGLSALSEEQEARLVENPRRVLVAVCTLNQWTWEEIVAAYDMSEAECIGHLLALDRLGMIRLLPGNRVRLTLARDFAWRPGGPIHRFFRNRIQADFMDADFDRRGEMLRFLLARIRPEDNRRFQQRLTRLLQAFTALHEESQASPAPDREGTCLLVALRPWEPKAFEAMRRS